MPRADVFGVHRQRHDALGLCVVGGDISIDDARDEAHDVGQRDAQHGEDRIFRERARREADFGVVVVTGDIQWCAVASSA